MAPIILIDMPLRFPTLVVAGLLFSVICASGQDWKTQYDQAIRQYQEGQYDQALGSAKEAYKSSAKLDLKNQAYTVQLITVICLDAGKADEGIEWITKETELFAQVDGTSSKT